MRPLALLVLSTLSATVLSAQTATAVASPRLPAAWYDVDVRGQLGFGEGAPLVGRRPQAGFSYGFTDRGGSEPHYPASRFIIAADSLLYRQGREWAEIPISAIRKIELVHRPANNANAWVMITYEERGEEHSVYVRRRSTVHQNEIVTALRHAVSLYETSARPQSGH